MWKSGRRALAASGGNAGAVPDRCSEKLNHKAKLSIYLSLYVPTLSNGYELWRQKGHKYKRLKGGSTEGRLDSAGLLRDRVRSRDMVELFWHQKKPV